jgi:ComF family protein
MALQITLVKVKEAFLDLLFPPRCIGCGMEGDFLCGSCCDLLPALEPPLCECCGVPLASGRFCQNCIDSNLDVDGIRSPFLHQGLAREAVHYLKYRNMKVLARPMAGLMAEYLKSNSLPVDIITAVPIHSRRMRQRGYNQSDLLAEELSRSIKLPTSRGTLTRLRNTPSQVSLGASERRSNVEGAFQCKYQIFQNRRVLLIDDVCTTGATLNACAVALKEAGALSVWGLTLSREC